VRNWAGNVTFAARDLLRPTSVVEVQSVVAASDQFRVLGSGHSFNPIADTTGDLISLADLPPLLDFDTDRALVKVSGGARYGDVAARIDERGFALPNTGSLPHIAIAGACATGTHGSGDRNRVLATAVSALTLVTPSGDLIELTRAHHDFRAVVLGLGSFGVVTDLTLDLVPSFQVRQYVYEDLAVDDVITNLDAIMASAYSVSIFSTWRDHRVSAVWLKSIEARDPAAGFFGGRPARTPVHPVPGVNPEFTTEQLGRRGPWYQRLPHFRLEFTPSRGDELQSEYFLDRVHGADALRVLDELGPILEPVLLTGEIRTVAADDLWVSPADGRDRLALHFTWTQDAEVPAVLDELERRLAPFDAVPHWGKVFRMSPQRVARLHPRLPEFAALVRQYDPAGKLANEFTTRFVQGPLG
jgi:xylitol oxidase